MISLKTLSGLGAAGGTADAPGSGQLASKGVSAQLAQSKVRITALEAELASSRKTAEDLQKQLNEASRKLKVRLICHHCVPMTLP